MNPRSWRALGSALATALATGVLAAAPASATVPPARPVVSASAVHARGAEAPAVQRATRPRPGTYRGSFYDSEGERLESFTFRVSRNGRFLKRFRASLAVICSYFPPEVEVHPLVYPTVRITSRGTFRKVWRPDDDSEIRPQGRFRRNRLVAGKLDYTVGVCVRVGYLKARRTGP